MFSGWFSVIFPSENEFPVSSDGYRASFSNQPCNGSRHSFDHRSIIYRQPVQKSTFEPVSSGMDISQRHHRKPVTISVCSLSESFGLAGWELCSPRRVQFFCSCGNILTPEIFVRFSGKYELFILY